jgi:hypothetical protein
MVVVAGWQALTNRARAIRVKKRDLDFIVLLLDKVDCG